MSKSFAVLNLFCKKKMPIMLSIIYEYSNILNLGIIILYFQIESKFHD